MEHRAVWLTKREVATLARVSVRTVERAIASGKLRSTKPNGKVLIHRRWVDAWLAAVLVLLLALLLGLSPRLGCAAHHRATKPAKPTSSQALRADVLIPLAGSTPFESARARVTTAVALALEHPRA